jgi:hypothetical protein
MELNIPEGHDPSTEMAFWQHCRSASAISSDEYRRSALGIESGFGGAVVPSALDDAEKQGGGRSSPGLSIGLVVGIVAAVVAVGGAGVGVAVYMRKRGGGTAQANGVLSTDIGDEMEAEPDTLDTLEPTTITTIADVMTGPSGGGRGAELCRDVWDNMSDEIC